MSPVTLMTVTSPTVRSSSCMVPPTRANCRKGDPISAELFLGVAIAGRDGRHQRVGRAGPGQVLDLVFVELPGAPGGVAAVGGETGGHLLQRLGGQPELPDILVPLG